ncbi:MAG TPA: hypothetical protein HA232_01475 [Methanocellales archaeon]|nr:hypothetical protein [Methanocellales archaeon]
MFLFVQQWETIRGKGTEYTNFVLQRHLPVMTKIGLRIAGGLHVVVGSGPRISVISPTYDLSRLHQAIESEEFLKVTKEFHEFVYNYSNAVLKSTGRVEIEDYEIEVGRWRFNQYYKLIHGVEEEYSKFLQNDYIPVLMKSGIRVKTEWQVILGTGLRILLEGITTNIHDVAQMLLSDEFRSCKRQLLSHYAVNYSTRILAPTGRVEIAYMLGEMTKSL